MPRCSVNPEETALLCDEICRLSRQMSDAAAEGNLDRLLPLLTRRGALLARAPRGEQGLRQIAEMDKQTERRLFHLRQQLVDELGQIQRGRVALEGYRADPERSASFFDRFS